jgi:predicted exporter
LCLSAAVLWSGEHYDDDIGLLQSRPPDLIAQEERIAALTGGSGVTPVLVVSAASGEANLQRLEQLDGQLQQWRRQGVIGDYQSPAQYLPSLARQQHNRNLITRTYASLEQPMTALGLAPPATQTPLLTSELFFRQSITEPVSLLWLPPDDAGMRHLSLVMLRGLTKRSVVQDWAASQAGVYFVDRRQQLSDLFGLYRLRVIEALSGAGAVLWLLAIWRYGLGRGSRVAWVPLQSCVLALALSAVMLPNLNLFNLLALLLVLGISLDFAVFSTENQRPGAAALSVSLAAATSLLSFGLLAMSSTQAVAGFGVTVAIGISVAWCLAPVACSRQEVERQ